MSNDTNYGLFPAVIPVGAGELQGELAVPPRAAGLVIFAHGSGSSRFSKRNRLVASRVRQAGVATLLMDLLTDDEAEIDAYTSGMRFNIPMLADRLICAAEWASEQTVTEDLPIGFFGASTGSAAALIAASELSDEIRAVVSRGGRPDLADDSLPHVACPVLLIVGSLDPTVADLNRKALEKLRCVKELKMIAGASHLFEEPHTLEMAADAAADWFERYLAAEYGKANRGHAWTPMAGVGRV